MANERSDSRRKQDPGQVGSDGWPSWMGDADPALAPKQPPKIQRPAPRAGAVGREQAANPARPAPAASAASPPPQAPASAPPRRGLRTFICVFVMALALVAGEVAARFRPDAAIRFQQAIADAVPASTRPAVLWRLAGGVGLALLGILVWQAGRRRRPLFLPIALVLCIVSSAVGLYRGGHDLDLERSSALLRGRAGSLEGELRQIQKKLESALADRDKATGSLQKSSMAIEERDLAISALRREIEELKKKLAEKD